MPDRNKTTSVDICEEEFSISVTKGSLPVFCAFPNDGTPHPAIILIHEIFGVNEHIKDLARRFARESYAVYAPDLFAYAAGLPEDKKNMASMREVWAGIADEQLIEDLQTLFSEIIKSNRVQGAPVGALGYCMGGAIAFIFACRTPLLSWVVDYYGRIYYPDLSTTKPRHPISYSGGLNCPFLGIFAGLDDLIGAKQIEEFQKKLLDLGKTIQIKVYPDARHAFFNDQREFYHPQAAADAWQKTLSFIDHACRKA